ncbi:hypothetical protein RKE29_26905, partial [Streptomyces sp. B1866]|nr:hypothetical protein [Streptomyces sp. B1866]
MTDTGQVPGEGLPASADGGLGQPPADTGFPVGPGFPGQQQPGVPADPAFGYLGEPHEAAPDHDAGEDDDLLLMPGAQGAWSEQQPRYPQPSAAPGPLGGHGAYAAPDAGAAPGGGPAPAPAEYPGGHAPPPAADRPA